MKGIRTKKTSWIFKLGIFAFTAYVMISLVSLQMEITAKQEQLASYQQQVEQANLAKQELERQIALGEDQDYLGKIAREKLGMGYSDERVFRDASGS